MINQVNIKDNFHRTSTRVYFSPKVSLPNLQSAISTLESPNLQTSNLQSQNSILILCCALPIGCVWNTVKLRQTLKLLNTKTLQWVKHSSELIYSVIFFPRGGRETKIPPQFSSFSEGGGRAWREEGGGSGPPSPTPRPTRRPPLFFSHGNGTPPSERKMGSQRHLPFDRIPPLRQRFPLVPFGPLGPGGSPAG